MTYGYCRMSSGWLSIFSYLIRMTKRHLNRKSSGWVNSWQYLIRMTFGHCSMSSGWHIISPYVIRMSYDNVIMSSGWHTLQLLSHPDEIANFDFPQHAVALQRFRTLWPRFTCAYCTAHSAVSFTTCMLHTRCFRHMYVRTILMPYRLAILWMSLLMCDKLPSYFVLFLLHDLLNLSAH